MKAVEDQYIDLVIRDNLLAELSAATGGTLGETELEGTDAEIAPRRDESASGAVNDIAESRWEGVPSDIQIEREVRSVLQHDPLVPFARVAPHVHAGWVTLEGRVDHAYEKEEAETVVLDLEDVRGVIDHVSVGPDGYDAALD